MLDELNITTLKEMYPLVVQDNFFLNAPFLAYLRGQGAFVPFGGGAFIQQTFLWRGLQTDAYTPGQDFNPVRRQILASANFAPKFYVALIVEYLEDLEVFNVGPNAIFSIIETDLAAAMSSLTSRIGVMIGKSGVGARIQHLNGWVEAMNDGVFPSYDNNIYTSYGTQLRSEVGNAYNSTPRFLGNADGSMGKMDYKELNRGYMDCNIGMAAPDIGVGNKAIIAHIEELMEPKQRIAQEADPYFGVHTGIRFKNAIIFKDDLWPSAVYGQNAEYGDFDTEGDFVDAPAAAASAATLNNWARQTIAEGTNCYVGEVFNWFNTRYWKVRVSNSPLFGFGFTGFLPSQINTRVVGRIHAALNLQCTAPRLQKQYYGHAA
jgi:hypothetical protein